MLRQALSVPSFKSEGGLQVQSVRAVQFLIEGTRERRNEMADEHSGVTIEQQIRWGDLDALGHVNNIVFFQFAESGRMAYFEALNISDFKEGPLDGPGMVSANLNFRRQLKYPGTVRVTTHVMRIGEKSFTMHYTLRDTVDDFIVADGESIMVWVDYAVSRAKPLSPAFVERVVELEKNPSLRPAPKQS